MGKQPAVIIIARHGARLDAADKGWHLTSPTPYDPPLTYGGWTQSRALGLRIASLLQNLEDSASRDTHESAGDRNGSVTEAKPRKRKHKVFIHSSPFQRCVQTGIGISSGIAQFQGIVANRERSKSRPRSSSSAARSSPRLHAVDTTAAAVAARSSARNLVRNEPSQTKTALRVDAFLGEWLSPDYFDLITPPPNSTMMVAGAKADLLRRAEDINSYSLSPSLANKGSQGTLWNSGRGSESSSDGPLDMKSLAQTLPVRDRTSSYSSGRISPFGRPAVQRTRSGERSANIGYIPPAPTYAISPVEPIPRGYVAHARDACVDIDYQWDSMRQPLEWGDGGEYGEEWSAMHKRFRKGLNHLIDWYGEHGSANLPDDDEAVPGVDEETEDSDVDEDIAVVLVTHGAGCNALIGALTEQPVLIDVGMASMTMAVRKAERKPINGHTLPHYASPVQIATPESSPEVSRVVRRSSSRSPGLSSQYEMKFVASSEHLRPGVDPTRLLPSHTSSPVMSASKTVPESRRRSTLASHSSAGAPIESTWSIYEGHRGNTSSALGSIRRLSTQSIPPQRSGSVSSVASMTGLWTPSTPPLTESSREDPPLGPFREPNRSPPVDESRDNSNKLGISFAMDQSPSDGGPLSTIPSNTTEVDPLTPVPTITTMAPTPTRESTDSVSDLPSVSQHVPSSIGRTLSQKGLWGSAPSGFQARDRGPKRRWTLQQE
ncbi:hypothetical protein K461DRAFT_329354 [Myriangium duriaei CBS 260.36]|uniref:Phosphoglycerate mutase n=1 Tax=Myriangium duriaei CBS 260.36 TaxID=1168546 RepID=A0A9P4IWU9_9PEZI|nr:hypothetical protein K461DRAFT_329354 [Myriangium duriaei CBS 260.36]